MDGNSNLGYRNVIGLTPTRETLTEYCNSEVGALMIILMFSLKSTRKSFLGSDLCRCGHVFARVPSPEGISSLQSRAVPTL